jgi:hypothetical protein
MIENLPLYIVVLFILTTLLAVGFFQSAVNRAGFTSNAVKIIYFTLPFWLIFQSLLAITGFYQNTQIFPPRLFLFAVFPAILFIVGLFIFSKEFTSKLPLKTLTLIHIVRIPVEIVLFMLYQNKQIPEVMTFEGRNFDILIGITAPIVTWLAFRNEKINKPFLIVWNILGLTFLLNIVTHAALSISSPIQQFGFEQPNKAVLFFPFIWLPSTIVPIVLFCHLASLRQLFKN